MKIKKVCEHCGLEFIARTTVTKYCGDHCAKRAYKAKVRDQKIKDSQAKAEAPSAHVIRKENENDKSYFALKTVDYLTVSEAAVLLKCGRRTIYRMIKAGKIPSANLSIRRIRLQRKDIDELFHVTLPMDLINQQDDKPSEEKILKDFLSIGQIQQRYNISETSLKTLINRHKIPKYPRGKFVYVPRKTIEFLLQKIEAGKYSG